MRTLIFSASVAAFTMLVTAPVPALAQPNAGKPAATKCVWSPAPGPRAPLRRVCEKIVDPREQWTGTGGPECDPNYKGKEGRWVWRAPPNYGPRGPMRPPVRVWIDGSDVC